MENLKNMHISGLRKFVLKVYDFDIHFPANGGI